MTDRMTCPRRAENGMHVADSPMVGAGEGLDEYRPGRGLVGQGRGCSYCGSMHPDDFMAAVRDGKEIGPTDKSYKAYVDGHRGKFYFQHLSAEQRLEFVERLNAHTVHVGYPGHFYVLPFFAQRVGG